MKHPTRTKQIVVMGGGAWGAAVASALHQNKSLAVHCLVRQETTAEALRQGFVPRLDNMPLTSGIISTTDASILRQADAIYVIVPAGATQDAFALISTYAAPDCPVIFGAKGLIDTAEKSGLLLPEFIALAAPDRPYLILSGPSFADEVIQGKPCALVASSYDNDLANDVISHFATSNLRLYSGDDPIGVAVGGAVKNVIALAAGICTGLGLGDNARAALITRGLAETGRLIQALGGNPITLTGLAGIGDLTLTASGPHSRNMAYGLALGAGTPLPNALSEGARTAPLLDKRAKALKIDMPITKAVTKALTGADLNHLISELLARPAAKE